MEILYKALQLIMCLSLLVTVHEFGHFMFAKIFKTRVEKFYLFFNPWFSIFKFKFKGTEYGLGWIPFGGYVKISGMIDESMDKEQMKQPPQSWEFRSKPAWQRLLIMTGGVIMNLVTAFVIYVFMAFSYGDKYVANNDVTNGYSFSAAAREMGFRSGDRVVSIDGKSVDNYQDVALSILMDDIESVEVNRDGEIVNVPVNKEFIPRFIEKGGWILRLRQPYVVDSVATDGRAFKAGVVKGDSVVSIDGRQIKYFDQYTEYTETLSPGDTVALGVVRDSSGVAVAKNINIVINEDKTIGVFAKRYDVASLYNISTKNYTFLESIPAGLHRAGEQIGNYWKQLKLIVSPETEAYKQVGSVVAMGNFFPSAFNAQIFWSITALFSIMLAVINILPIPALDGGHVTFLLYEVITRRKPSDKFMEIAQTIGMILLLALMIFALGNDIVKLFI